MRYGDYWIPNQYFEKDIDADNIIHSIQTAKKWNSDQTRIIIYTNKEFGVPKGKTAKNSKQTRILEEAQRIGLQIEWMLGKNILDAVNEQPIAYNIFFNQQSHIQNLNQDVKDSNESKFRRINNCIRCGTSSSSLDRSRYVDEITRHILSGTNVAIVGESGAGKSAIVKYYYQKCRENNDSVFLALDAGQLNSGLASNVFSFLGNYSLREFCDYYKKYRKLQYKVVYIDAAEKLLENDESADPDLFFDKLIKDGWIFLFTCKANAQQDFFEVMRSKYQINVEPIEIKRLTLEELRLFTDTHDISLPNDKKLLNQLRVPFYLARYIELGQNRALSVKDFKNEVWNQKVRGTKRGPEQIRREKCMLEVVSKLQNATSYFVGYDLVGDSDAAYLLIAEDVLAEEKHKGYVVKHDIYSDWAMEYLVDRNLSESSDLVAAVNSLPQTVGYQNAFAAWLREQIGIRSRLVDELCDSIFVNEMLQAWVPSVFYAIAMECGASDKFFEKYARRLKGYDYYWFGQFATVLCVSCKKIDSYFTFNGRTYPRYIPEGYGWESTIHFMYQNQETYYLSNLSVVYNVISGYLAVETKKLNAETAHQAGILALRIFKEKNNAQINGDSFYIENAEDWGYVVCQYAHYIRTELLEVFNEVLSHDVKVKHEIPYYDLMDYIVKQANMATLLPICMICHDALPKVLAQFWKEEPRKEPFRPLVSLAYKSSEYFFGLDEDLNGVGGYFPSSAFQTPVYPLLMAEYSNFPKQYDGIDFVIDFVNQCANIYKSRGMTFDEVIEINVVLPNGNTNKLIASQALWNLYRGTSGLSMPNVLECIHMALEKYLLHLCEKNNNTQDVSKLLAHILNRSCSVSIWAIVASVVSAHYDDYFDTLLLFYQDYHFLSYDLTRFSHELTAYTLAFAYKEKEYLEKERSTSNALKHRQVHLEKILQFLQISYANSDSQDAQQRLRLLYKRVDVLKEQVKTIPIEYKNHEDYMIARIDCRSMIKEQVTLQNGVKAIQYTPNLTDAQKKLNAEIGRTNTLMVRGFKLREWVDNVYAGNIQNLKSPYDDIHFVLSEVSQMEQMIDSRDTALFSLVGDEFLPYMANAVLLQRFYDELSTDVIAECKNKVLEALGDADFLTSNSLSGLEVCLNSIPRLLRICNSDERKGLKNILFSYVSNHSRYGNTRPSDLVRTMLVHSHFWQEFRSFMEECLTALLDSLKDWETEVAKSLSIVCFLADDKSHMDIVEKCLNCISSEWAPHISRHAHEYYSQARFDDAELVADVIINADEERIGKFISLFKPFITRNNHYEPLINCFLSKVVETNRYQQFWLIWNALYENMILGMDKAYGSDALNSYLLSPSYIYEPDEKWFAFKEKDVDFYNRVLKDAGYNPNVLCSVVKVFNTIGADYDLEIVEPIAHLMKNNLVYDGEVKKIGKLISVLEGYLRNIFAKYEDVVENNKKIRKELESILVYMKQHGSTQASDYLRT